MIHCLKEVPSAHSPWLMRKESSIIPMSTCTDLCLSLISENRLVLGILAKVMMLGLEKYRVQWEVAIQKESTDQRQG